MRTARFLIPAVILIAAAFLMLTSGTRSDEADKGFLSDLISRALSTPATRVSIGDVQGALSSDATIRDITISDKDGVWFRLDRVRLVWRRLALLSRRLEIDKLEIGKLEIMRRPVAADETVSGDPLLPELPVKIQVADFLLRELALGEPVFGVAAQLTASGSASLGNPTEGLSMRFDAQRLDAPGTLVARLNYAAEKLDLTMALNEPAGGILARAANIPGLPPVTLDLSGGGTLDAFAAKLTFSAGDTIGATGQADLQRQGVGRRLSFALRGQIEGLLPGLVAPVFAGITELNGETIFADEGIVTIPKLSVASRTAQLDLTGRVDQDHVVDLTLTARAVPTDQARTVAGGAEIKTLAFDGKVTGQLAAPQIAGNLLAEDVNVPMGRLENLKATFSLSPNGPLSEETTRIGIVADAAATGVAFADPVWARAFGDRMALTIRATASPDGATEVDTAHLSSPSVDMRYSGSLGTQGAVGLLKMNLPDLSRFGGLASLDLRGALGVEAQVRGLLSKAAVVTTIDAKATRFSTGFSAADGLVGGQLTMEGTVRVLRNGGFGFQALRLTGAHMTARIDGNVTPENADLNAAIDIADLRRADKRLTGRGALTAQVTGTLERPNAVFHAEVSDATALGKPIPHLAIDATAMDLLGLIDVRTNLSGIIDGTPATGSLRLVKGSDGGWLLDPLDVVVGSAKIFGNLMLDGSDLASGHLSVDARNLEDLSPLVLTPLAGDLRAEIVLESIDGKQTMSVDAQGERIRIADTSVDRFEAKASLVDLYAKPIVNAVVAAEKAVVAGVAFSQIKLDVQGTTTASDFVLDAQARGFDLEARGRLVPEGPIRLDIETFTARRDRRQIKLVHPATIAFAGGGVFFEKLDLFVDGGTISMEGRAGSSLDLRVEASALPLSAVDIIVPGTGLSGTLEGFAQVGGIPASPTGEWRVRVLRLGMARAQSIGAPLVDLSAQGRLSQGSTSVDGTISGGRAGTFRVNGRIPLNRQDNLDLSAKGRLDLSVTNNFLSAAGRQVSGTAVIDLQIGGAVMEPTINGSLSLSGGSFRDAAQGVRLDNITGRIVARGSNIEIERLTAITRNAGTVSASGRVTLNSAGGFPGDINITGSRAELVSNELMTVVADLALRLSGPLARDPRIAGQVRIVSMDVTVPERLSAAVRPIAGTRHVKPPPIVAKRLAMEAASRANNRGAPVFNASLDLVLQAPNRVYVRGRGIDAELGGELRLTGTALNPVAHGAFEMRRGRLTVIGTRLDFTRGRLTFTGSLTPQLDFVAQTNAGEVTARVSVTGSAAEPQFAFSSDPYLPQDEVLSRILFSRASGGLSATQALTLAQAAAQFSGGGGGVFESLRKSLGIQGLDISMGAAGGLTIGLSRAISDRISDRISVGVKAGASTEETGVSVDIDVTRRIRVQGEVGASGSTAVGVGAEWEY